MSTPRIVRTDEDVCRLPTGSVIAGPGAGDAWVVIYTDTFGVGLRSTMPDRGSLVGNLAPALPAVVLWTPPDPAVMDVIDRLENPARWVTPGGTS